MPGSVHKLLFWRRCAPYINLTICETLIIVFCSFPSMTNCYTWDRRTMFYFYTLKLKGLFMGSHMTTTRYLRTYCSVTQLQALWVSISYCHCAGYFLKFTESKKFVRFIILFMSLYIRCSLQKTEQLFNLLPQSLLHKMFVYLHQQIY